MINFENVEVVGFEAAIRGMRNPMNSWNNSDSKVRYGGYDGCEREFHAGEADLKLMRNLASAGTDHGKFLRMLTVYVDVVAPLYWWKEFETYKVGTVANSCSTMHKIHAKEFSINDFSHEHLLFCDGFGNPIEYEKHCDMRIGDNEYAAMDGMIFIVDLLNHYRRWYLETKDKAFWWQMIQLLPSSYNQRRTVMLNYAVLLNMYKARKNHKLDEWKDFCKWMEELPYFKEICCS